MSTDHQGQVEKILAELGHKIDELMQEAKGAKDELRDEVEEKIKDLKVQKEKLEDEYQDFKQKNEGKWVDIKTHLFAAAEEIKKAAETAFKSNT
jgi:vacuolar-type H+-ATPase subunit I/STV1